MQKIRLLLIPFFVGLALVIYSWFVSYPLSIQSVNDFLFNHVSPFYWVGLSVLLVSTLALLISVKNDAVRCLLVAVLVLSMFSMNFFYSSFPGSDAHYFQGLTEYSAQTKSLSPTTPARYYYEYPAFFVLSDLFVSFTGIEVSSYAFLFYAVAVGVLALSIYKYASRLSKEGSFLAVASFFIIMYYFLNIQFAPFTLALVLLFVAITVDACLQKGRAKNIVLVLLFVGIVFTHLFAPLFFVLYKLFSFLLSRRRENLLFFLFSVSFYLVYQLSFAPLTFSRTMANLIPNYELSLIAEATLAGASVPIDIIAQNLSRTLVIVTFLIVLLGFVAMILNRRTKLPIADKAVLLSGIFYVSVGLFVDVLGSRAWPLVGLSGSLGAVYLLGTRYRKAVLAAFLIIVALFVSLPMHQSFYDGQIFFQSREENAANNFVLSHYDWSDHTSMLTHYRVITYLWAKQASNVTFESEFSTPFPDPEDFDSVYYTVGLGKSLLRQDYLLQDIVDTGDYNVPYDNGLSVLTIRVVP